jgi:hypothetical protein
MPIKPLTGGGFRRPVSKWSAKVSSGKEKAVMNSFFAADPSLN